MNKKDIDIIQLKAEAECAVCNADSYPTTAWCPIGCGLSLVCIEDNIYYCAKCDKEFEIVERNKKK